MKIKHKMVKKLAQNGTAGPVVELGFKLKCNLFLLFMVVISIKSPQTPNIDPSLLGEIPVSSPFPRSASNLSVGGSHFHCFSHAHQRLRNSRSIDFGVTNKFYKQENSHTRKRTRIC